MAIEVVVFHVQPDVTSENLQAAIDATTALLQSQTGFKTRTIGKAESGEWLDIIHWDSVESAKKAMTAFQSDEAGQRFSSYLDLSTIQVYYLETD
ncbi:MAG: hypothetical protein ABI970_18230 [Chloroflexota bacterium]